MRPDSEDQGQDPEHLGLDRYKPAKDRCGLYQQVLFQKEGAVTIAAEMRQKMEAVVSI